MRPWRVLACAATAMALGVMGCGSRGCASSPTRIQDPDEGLADGQKPASGQKTESGQKTGSGARPGSEPNAVTLTARSRAPIAPGSPNGGPGAELVVESATYLVADETHLYWSDGRDLWRVAKKGRTSVRLSQKAGPYLALNKDSVFFWSNPAGILGVPKSGGPSFKVVPEAKFAAFVGDEASLYWTDGRRVLATPVKGGQATELLVLEPGEAVGHVSAADASSLYLARGRSLIKVPKRGGAVDTLATLETEATIVGLRGNYLYAPSRTGLSLTLERVGLSGGAARVFLGGSNTCLLDVLGSFAVDADASHVYFGCATGNNGALVRAKVDADPTSPVEVVAKLSPSCQPMHVAVDDDSVYFVARCVGGPGPIYRVPKSGVTFPVDALNLSPRETVAHRGTQPVPVESDTATKSPCAFTERCEGNKRERCKQLPEGAYIDSFACRAPNAACVMSKGHAICVHDPPAACAPTVRRQDYCDGPNRVTCDQPEVGWAGPQWEMGRGCGHGPCATVAGQGTCPNF